RAPARVHRSGKRPGSGSAARGHDPELRFQARHSGRFRSAVRRAGRLEPALNLRKFLIPQYVGEGKSYLTIGIGCTGGRHRSVAIAESLKKGLGSIPGVRVKVTHR